jgi:hypothetical protein
MKTNLEKERFILSFKNIWQAKIILFITKSKGQGTCVMCLSIDKA